MTKLIYPGAVRALFPFGWEIVDAAAGVAWTATTTKDGVTTAYAEGVVGDTGTVAVTALAPAPGAYEVLFTFSTGKRQYITLQSIAEWEFIWVPDVGVSEAKKPKVREVVFGDGYSQQTRKGLNSNLGSWSVSFTNLTDVESMQIMRFLDTMGGYTAFKWRDPSGRTARFLCKDYSRNYDTDDSNSIRATFEQTTI